MCNSFGISLLTQTPNCPWDRKTSGRVGLWNSHGLIHVQTNASVWLWVHVCRSALTDPHFSVYFWDFGGARRVNQERKWLTALWRCLPLCSHISTGQRALSRLCWYLRWRGGKRSKPAVECMSHFTAWSPWADLSVSVCPSASRARAQALRREPLSEVTLLVFKTERIRSPRFCF